MEYQALLNEKLQMENRNGITKDRDKEFLQQASGEVV